MGQVTFTISDAQHKEWFIAALLSHIRVLLTQQKIKSQVDALEIAMKLEASPIGESNAGMVQIQKQLAKLTIQLDDIKRGKEVKEEIWCIRCRAKGHDKDNCPLFQNYLNTRAPNPLNPNQNMNQNFNQNAGL